MAGDDPKRAAARAAVERFVESGTTVGLGSGSTSAFVVERIGELLAAGELRDVRGIPTSEKTAGLAGEAGIPLDSLADARPGVALDGADEVTAELTAVKGWGGALLREKIVASASQTGLVIVVDDSKEVEVLGSRGPLPVEVEPYGWQVPFENLAALGCEPELRMDADRPDSPETPFLTDGGHYTVDCAFGPIEDPDALETAIKRIPGVLESGLFVDLARAAVIAGDDGVRIVGG